MFLSVCKPQRVESFAAQEWRFHDRCLVAGTGKLFNKVIVLQTLLHHGRAGKRRGDVDVPLAPMPIWMTPAPGPARDAQDVVIAAPVEPPPLVTDRPVMAFVPEVLVDPLIDSSVTPPAAIAVVIPLRALALCSRAPP